MAFTCPDCLVSGTLTLTDSIVLPPDSRSDDIILQSIRCRRCGFRGAAIYEESRRGGIDSESWDHCGYRLEKEELAELNRLIKTCPAKKDMGCDCPSHRALNKRGEHGRWQAPFEANWERSFPMRRS